MNDDDDLPISFELLVWGSALRTAKVALPLTRRDPTETVEGAFGNDWSFDDF